MGGKCVGVGENYHREHILDVSKRKIFRVKSHKTEIDTFLWFRMGVMQKTEHSRDAFKGVGADG